MATRGNSRTINAKQADALAGRLAAAALSGKVPFADMERIAREEEVSLPWLQRFAGARSIKHEKDQWPIDGGAGDPRVHPDQRAVDIAREVLHEGLMHLLPATAECFADDSIELSPVERSALRAVAWLIQENGGLS